MTGGHNHTREELVSRGEIAALAGVGRSAITNWERRHDTFPVPLKSADAEYFRIAELIPWLDSRPVPTRNRRAEEARGVTYGDRLRKALESRPGMTLSASGPHDSPSVPTRGGEDVRQQQERAVAKLLDPSMTRQWGARTFREYFPVLSCLLLLRCTDLRSWSDLCAWVMPGARQPATPADLLERVGSRADELLRDRGLLPTMKSSLKRLVPEPGVDLLHLLRLIDTLDADAFGELLDAFAVRGNLDSREAFTPRGVADLLSGLSLGEGPVNRISDPYARGGELLAAMISMSGRSSVPEVHASGPHPGPSRLAAINLMIHGAVPEVDVVTRAPWLDPQGDGRPAADRVLVNPPFNASSGESRRVAWRYGDPPPSNDNLAWPQHALSRLKPGGRACIVMADNAAVSDHPKERAIRQAMVDDGVVECVVALPANLFTATSVSACIWVLTTPSRRSTVHFINARGAGRMVSRTQRELGPDDVHLVREVHRALVEGRPLPTDARVLGRSVSARAIEKELSSLSPVDYVSAERDDAVTAADVARVRTELLTAGEAALAADETALPLLFDGSEGAATDGVPQRSTRGWTTRPLDDLCTIQAGPSPSRLSAKMQSPGGEVPVVHPKHLRDRRISGIEESKVSARDADRLRRFRLREGDILCTRTGTVGPSALVGPAEAGHLYSNNLLRLSDFTPDADPRYVLAYLSHPQAQSWIKDRAGMTTVASIKTKTLQRLQVPLPPLEEQRRIGELFQALDSQIVAHRLVAAVAERVHGELTSLLVGGALVPTSRVSPQAFTPHSEGNHQ